MRAFILLIGLLFITISAFAQGILPRYMTDSEKAWINENSGFIHPNTNRGFVPPVDMELRSMGEWEEMQSISIAWTGFPVILSEIVRHGQEEAEVIIICADSNQVKSFLSARGVPISDQLSFIQTNFNSIWIRDYGPNPAYINDVDSLVLVDWIYNRPRFQDDLVSFAIGNFKGLQVFSTNQAPLDLVNTGGNYMSDGMGRGFSSDLVLEENGPDNVWGQSNHTRNDVEAIMERFLGVEDYFIMTRLPFDVIHHIDMHMKVLDEETILMGEYPPGVADGPQIEANLQFILSNIQTPFGNPYDVVRIPMPPDAFGRYPDLNGDYRTYANAFFINKTIIVPTYEERYDTTALRIWQETMPGYNIVGINCNDIIPLSGALHCITKELGVRDPLLIQHSKIKERVNDGSNYTVEAIIKHREGIQEAYINYRLKGSATFSRAQMELKDVDNQIWSGEIPFQDEDSEIEYFIESTANNGKYQVRPITAPEGYWTFKVSGITSAEDFDKSKIELQEIFPNPASAITCIPFYLPRPTDIHVDLVDMNGRLISNLFAGEMQEGNQKVFFDAGVFEAGVYLIRIKSGKGTYSLKLIIK